ncbi:protein kinase [Pseudomonas syringae pv. syringae]|uniref:protein kinase n=1 Tax=Pseudomonas syringae TaxID=317 RepID=UPI001F0E32BD|nr:protein kinase [Pseudomonas syringae]MCH5530978.1 protein kinase [Pseudomonas syringae pv. syringae]MCH5539073.1 protein kinase [Pseudomonas syringae pv. syringae]MCH5544328.1 protein kinase [Pseudomonas syringae pv. syringae]MCH5604079.1 protein kinase [Pseudomonas syringae pv. syringae]MCH5607663.1 protein kinase [Pseudomonas syringae pv. syringae]
MSDQKPVRARRMSSVDIRLIIHELDCWARGERTGELSWSLVEEYSGFTRQALNSRPEIKAAFGTAKVALKGGIAKTRMDAVADNASLLAENNRLKAEIALYAAREAGWKARWQRIAYHIRSQGFQMGRIDRPAPDGAKLPSDRDAGLILRSVDMDIPPSGRV